MADIEDIIKIIIYDEPLVRGYNVFYSSSNIKYPTASESPFSSAIVSV